MKLGIIARSDKTGLGNQTRNLVKLLNPHKILLIDSESFNGNKQYPEIYDGYNVTTIKGFPTRADVMRWTRDIDVILTCEIFYSSYMITYAKNHKIRTYNQFNYEFLDYLNSNMPMCTTLIAPSYWHLEDVSNRFGNVVYLPPPTDEKMFTDAMNENLSRTGKKRFLHISGNKAVHDRNGTESLLDSLKYTKSDFELVIKAQKDIGLQIEDNRVTVDYSSPENEVDLYRGFDALILPRKYGGLCLPMNEGLLSALPVIMTDVSPNNKVLPKEWLVETQKTGEFMTRTMIDINSAIPQNLAQKIDWLCKEDLEPIKRKAYEIGYSNYSFDVLQSKWKELIR